MKRCSERSPAILSVSEGSIAAELGWLPGDRVLRINEASVEDVLDLLFVEGDAECEILLERGDGEQCSYIIEKDEGEPLGIDLEPLTIRKCRNNCVFCFVHQQPKGLRKSLSVKDEDYRFSFLHGNYVTLSPVTKAELDRIIRLHLSPLYISVHTTDEELRRMMLGRKNPAMPIVTVLEYLAAGGITMHTQIVLCPEINDGDQLQRTLNDLEPLFPAVASVAVVPVGLTRHRRGLTNLRRVTCREANHLVRTLATRQDACRRQFGVSWLHLADEFYCLSKQDFPESSHYDDFPQLENGVGMIRLFIDEWEQAFADAADETGQLVPSTENSAGLMTGTLFAPFLKKLVRRYFPHHHQQFPVIPVANSLFGPSVSVTGLLPGQAIVKRCRNSSSPVPNTLLLPSVMFNTDEVTLDDMTARSIAEQTGKNILVVPSDGREFVRYLLSSLHDLP